MLLFCLALLPRAQATPETALPGLNTADGLNALASVTTGTGNTAVGWFSLKSNTDGSLNTAVGAGTLLLNIGDQTTGDGIENTAVGAAALLFNTVGSDNTAVGTTALLNNTEGNENTALGSHALHDNNLGFANTAVGVNALLSNTSGIRNTALGSEALRDNNLGDTNTATGRLALANNTDGSDNTAHGYQALFDNVTGDDNTAVGRGAGSDITGSGNVCIGEGTFGEAGVANRTYIRNVNTLAQPIVAGIDGVTVRLSDGRLGHGVSSRRYKQDIKPMEEASEALYALKPVTFHYNKEIDPMQTLDFGLIAEEVAEVNPELAVRDGKGKISNYRRDAVNAMLLNEFLKEHRKNEAREATITRLQKQIEVLTGGLQKVSAQVEMSRHAPQTVVNNQ